MKFFDVLLSGHPTISYPESKVVKVGKVFKKKEKRTHPFTPDYELEERAFTWNQALNSGVENTWRKSIE